MKILFKLFLFLSLFTVSAYAQFPWNLDRIDSRTLAFDGTYNFPATGAGVNVYVVDSGVEYANPEFGGRASNGYGRYSADCSGHGTAVAALIASTSYGVAKQANIISVKVYCTGVPTDTDVIKGLQWIKRDASRSGKRSVVNISLNGNSSGPLNSAVRDLIASGVTVVASAGNSQEDACWHSPSSVQEAIVVGGTSSNDAALYYSNYGPCVDLYAPGEGVWTFWQNAPIVYFSGTSAAAPHVAGLAAMYLERNPTATPAVVQTAIVANATPDVLIGANPNLFIYVF